MPPNMPIVSCPSCGFGRSWRVRRGRRKCKRCRREFGALRYPVAGFRATEEEWRRCVAVFLRERTIRRVAEELGRSHCLAERMAMRMRIAMAADLPVPFEGPVEMDETYIGGQRKNKRLHIRRVQGRRGHGTDKLPIVGIFDRATGSVFVDVEPRRLDIAFVLRTVGERVVPGALVMTDGFKMYRNLRGGEYRHTFVDHAGGEYVRGDVHTNDIEGFWGVLKRRMGCIGGMRRKYLRLFVGEIAWKFNRRRMPLAERERALYAAITAA